MRIVLAFLRAGWLSASSYRFNFVVSLAGVMLSVIPLYFISGALQGVMNSSIRNQGEQYFGFLLVGISTFWIIPTAVTALPTTIGASISNGNLESILATPASLPAVLAGLVSYQLSLGLVRIALLFAVGALLGAPIHWETLPLGVLVLGLIVISYIPFALIGSAMIVVARSVGPFLTGVVTVSALLGGVYFPTNVIPSWIERISNLIPLTYGLRALRRVVLSGASLAVVQWDIMILVGATMMLFAFAILVFSEALRHARRAGSLSTY